MSNRAGRSGVQWLLQNGMGGEGVTCAASALQKRLCAQVVNASRMAAPLATCMASSFGSCPVHTTPRQRATPALLPNRNNNAKGVMMMQYIAGSRLP